MKWYGMARYSMAWYGTDGEDERSVSERFLLRQLCSSGSSVAFASSFQKQDCILRYTSTHHILTVILFIENESHMLDRYPKYLDVMFSMFRELIKLGRHHTSQCVLLALICRLFLYIRRFSVCSSYIGCCLKSYKPAQVNNDEHNFISFVCLCD